MLIGVRGNQAGVNGEPIGFDQTFGHAALDDGFEQMAQDVALAKAPVRFLEKVEWSATSGSNLTLGAHA